MNWTESLNAVLQPLLITLIQILVPILLGAAIVWVKKMVEQAKLQIDAKTLTFIETLLQSLVVSAEANGLTAALEKEVFDKKTYVLDRAETELLARGIKVDPHLLSDLVEQIVYDEFNRYPAELK
jgi:flagellar biosynthesis protein FliQ